MNNKTNNLCCGTVVLFGSGETAVSAQEAYRSIMRDSARPVRVSIFETPAGFQPNSADVAENVADFLTHHLHNYRPQISIIPARKRDTEYSTNNENIITPVLNSDIIYLGAGSPSYTVRQLDNSLAWQTIRACHRQGAALVLASAAAIAISMIALPVYEIYKVGEDLHWNSGLDLFGPFGLRLAFISHWNNTEGGAKLDTSRCYMGQVRFKELLSMLPSDITVVGIEEHTALAIDLNQETCRVMGKGNVSIIRGRKELYFTSERDFLITELGNFNKPEPQYGISPDIWEHVISARLSSPASYQMQPSPEVLSLMQAREKARTDGDWEKADQLRLQINALGWQINDGREGPHLTPDDSQLKS